MKLYQSVMLKIFFVLTIIICTTGFVSAQRFGQHIDLSINAGYATFNQHSLKDFQQEVLSEMPVQGKILSSFPGYLNYSIDAIFFDSTYFVGVMMGHTSTGARIQYTDYSGSITYDQVVKMNYFGLVAAKRILSTRYGNVFLGMDLLAYRNSVEFEYSEVVLDQLYKSSISLKSLNLALGTFIQIHKRFGNFLVKGSGGYEFHMAKDLYYEESGQTFLTSSGETLKVNADGLRFSLGIGYSVYTRKRKK